MSVSVLVSYSKVFPNQPIYPSSIDHPIAFRMRTPSNPSIIYWDCIKSLNCLNGDSGQLPAIDRV